MANRCKAGKASVVRQPGEEEGGQVMRGGVSPWWKESQREGVLMALAGAKGKTSSDGVHMYGEGLLSARAAEGVSCYLLRPVMPRESVVCFTQT